MSGPSAAEGSWFAVPLRDNGFAVGVVARANPRGALMGYFFGPKRASVPILAQIAGLTIADAIFIRRFGHLGIKEGRWPVIGRTPDWDRSEWPMPAFIRYEELTGRSFRVIYHDNDPHLLVREIQVEPGGDEQGPKDGLAGAGYVEIALTRLLSG